MKKSTLLLVIAAAIIASVITHYSLPKRVEYLARPVITDTTVLTAKIKIGELQQLYGILVRQAAYGKDTAERRRAIDSTLFAIKFIDSKFSDTTLNPVFKK